MHLQTRQRSRPEAVGKRCPAFGPGTPPGAHPRPPPRRRSRMSVAERSARSAQPGLVFFYSPLSGNCRRVDGFLAQVLQRRRNHGTFKLYRVDEEARPDRGGPFGVARPPGLGVVEDKLARARLEKPRGCRDIEDFLAPWLK